MRVNCLIYGTALARRARNLLLQLLLPPCCCFKTLAIPQAACTKQQQQPQQQQQLLPSHHKQPPAGYLVSQQNQHVAPAAAGEVQPLRLGRNLELQVKRQQHSTLQQLRRLLHAQLQVLCVLNMFDHCLSTVFNCRCEQKQQRHSTATSQHSNHTNPCPVGLCQEA